MPSSNKLSKSKPVILPHLSAIAAKNARPSRAIAAAIQSLKHNDVRRVCEIGCGLLANTPHILRAFPYVIVTDREEQIPRIQAELESLAQRYSSYKGFVKHSDLFRYTNYFHAAIIINVLHILPSHKERLDLLKTVHRTLKRPGLLFIDVPRNEYYYKTQVKTATPHNDGYLMRRGSSYTFYRNMELDDLDKLIAACGFTVERRIYIDHRNSLLCTKKFN